MEDSSYLRSCLCESCGFRVSTVKHFHSTGLVTGPNPGRKAVPASLTVPLDVFLFCILNTAGEDCLCKKKILRVPLSFLFATL